MNDIRVFGKRRDVSENNVETGFFSFIDFCRNISYKVVKVINVIYI